MKWLYGKCESLILWGVGLAILWLALSPQYNLLMNPNFKWLTVIGSVLLLVMGSAALFTSRKQHPGNILLFGVLLLITFIGQPYLPSESSKMMQEPQLPAGLWDQIDQARFPRHELTELFRDPVKKVGESNGFTIIGIAKRLDVLDEHGSFAILKSIMVCCIADAYAGGFRVSYNEWETIEDGQWVMVSGTLAPEEAQITVPNFQFGMARLSIIEDAYVIRPEKVMSYNRVDQLPLLTEHLDSDGTRLFAELLKQCGLWGELGEKGPFTVFAPVDRAIEALGDDFPESSSPASLKQILAGHIIPGRLFTGDLFEKDTLKAINGDELKIEAVNGKLRVGQSRLLFKDKEAINGVIHFIYPVILPDAFSSGESNDE